jgi:hypothetical protein
MFTTSRPFTGLVLVTLTVAVGVCTIGCGRKAAESDTATKAAVANAAPGAAASPTERRSPTGADPQKAPPYPAGYGMPQAGR